MFYACFITVLYRLYICLICFYIHVFYGEWPLIAWSGQPNPNIKFNYRSNCHRTLCVWGRQRKSWLPSCSTVGVLLLRVSSCWGVGLKIRELAAVLLPAVLRTRVARVISFCLLRACLCPIYLSCRLLSGNGDWGTPNFFSCGDFCKIFLPTIYQFTCYADERPWSEDTYFSRDIARPARMGRNLSLGLQRLVCFHTFGPRCLS